MKIAPLLASIFALVLASGSGPGFTQQPASTEIAGGRGGNGFVDPAPQMGTRVMEVHVRSGAHVDSVQLMFATPDGSTVMGPRHGGSGGGLNVFRLDSDEYVIGLSGRYGNYIDSLRIHTNKRSSPLFGGSGGDRDYRIDVPAGSQAVGFTGRAGNYLDAIGVTFVAIRRVQAGQTTIAGGRGGSAFADREIPVGAKITEVRIRAGNRVDAVQAIYVMSNGSTLEGERHGGGGGSLGSFRLDSDEYIIGLSGRCGDYLDSLRLRTNKRTSPLFGGGGGSRDFTIEVPAGNEAIGFAGRAGNYVDAIGLSYAETATPTRRPIRQRRSGN